LIYVLGDFSAWQLQWVLFLAWLIAWWGLGGFWLIDWGFGGFFSPHFLVRIAMWLRWILFLVWLIDILGGFIFSSAGRYDGEGEEQAGAARLHRGLAGARRQQRSHAQGRQEEGEDIFYYQKIDKMIYFDILNRFKL
jgi:hypothetical protein